MCVCVCVCLMSGRWCALSSVICHLSSVVRGGVVLRGVACGQHEDMHAWLTTYSSERDADVSYVTHHASRVA